MIDTKVNNKRMTSGISLIALSVTIVVMIILAGVAVSTLTGDNGVLKQAQVQKDTANNKVAYTSNTINVLESQLYAQVKDLASANPEDVISGKTYYKDEDTLKTGTMPNNVSKSTTLSAGQTYTIPKGYHSGTGTVTASTLESQTSTATASQILNGYTAYVNGNKITGSMTNNGAQTVTLSAGQSYKIPVGYHNENGAVAAASLASQTFGTATASQILRGQTSWVNGSKVTGSMPNLSGESTITHASDNGTKVVLGDYSFFTVNSDGTKRYEVRYVGTGGYITSNTLFARPATDFGTASATQVLSGTTFTSENGLKIRGAMPNYATGTPNHVPYYRNNNGRLEFAVNAGYHGCWWDGGQYEYLNYNEVASALGITSEKILSGYTIAGVAGSIPKYNYAQRVTIMRNNNNRIEIAVPEGYYGCNWVTANEYEYIEYKDLANVAGVTSDKIVQGQSILGVSGTVKPADNLYIFYRVEGTDWDVNVYKGVTFVARVNAQTTDSLLPYGLHNSWSLAGAPGWGVRLAAGNTGVTAPGGQHYNAGEYIGYRYNSFENCIYMVD